MSSLLDLCEANEWQCEAGICIPITKRCDNAKDCPDGTDELDCPGTIFRFVFAKLLKFDDLPFLMLFCPTFSVTLFV